MTSVITVQVNHGTKNLLPWFMVPAQRENHEKCLSEFFKLLIRGNIDPDICLPEEYHEAAAYFQCASSEAGPWTGISSLCQLASVLDSRKTYIKMMVRRVQPEQNMNQQRSNAFTILMQNRESRILPNLSSIPTNKKKELSNEIIRWLSDMDVGWQPCEVKTAGESFVLPDVNNDIYPACRSCAKDENKQNIKKRKRNLVADKQSKKAAKEARLQSDIGNENSEYCSTVLV
jgi:hypothetical protein